MGALEKPLGAVALDHLQTADVTRVLTEVAKPRAGGRTLSHLKSFLSGVYVFAIAQGFAKQNPAFDAEWLCKVARPKRQQPQYSLEQVLAMLAILEPIDLRAAAAVALGYFAALRPNEIRGLRWEDYNGEELQVCRTVWRQTVGETKTEDSAASVPVIAPLRGLLEKLAATYGRGRPHPAKLQTHAARPEQLELPHHRASHEKGRNSLGWLLRRAPRDIFTRY